MNEQYGMPPLPPVGGSQPTGNAEAQALGMSSPAHGGQAYGPNPSTPQVYGQQHQGDQSAATDGHSASQFGQSAQYGQPAQYGQSPQYGQPAQHPVHPGMQPAPWAPGEQTQHKRRNPWKLAVAIVLPLLLVGGLIWGGFAPFGKQAGAQSPEAAVENFVRSSVSFNLADLASNMAPSEAAFLTEPFMKLTAAPSDSPRGVTVASALATMQSAVDIEVEELKVTPVETDADAVLVNIETARVRVDGDEAQLRQGVSDLVYAITYDMNLMTGQPQARAHTSAEQAAESAMNSVTAQLPDVQELTDQGFTSVVAVREAGGWYVSPILSLVPRVTGMAAGSGIEVTTPEGQVADSPEAAGMEFAEAVATAATAFDYAHLGKVITAPERLLIAFLFETGQLNGRNGNSTEYSASGSFDLEERDGLTILHPNNLELSGGYSTITFDRDCATGGYSQKVCISDNPTLRALNLHTIGLVAVEENGGWVVSPYQTAALALNTAVDAYLKLREEGRLNELVQF